MIVFYSILIAVCVYVEISSKINTDNILNKIGIACIIIGALLGIYNQCFALPHENNLIAIGVFLHFICEMIHARKKHHRRSSDRKPV